MQTTLKVSGSTIKALRQQVKLSQTQLARLLGLSQPEIALLESGKRGHLYVTRERLANAHNQLGEWLLGQALQRLKRQMQKHLAAGTAGRFCGIVPPTYIAAHLDDIVTSIGVELSPYLKRIGPGGQW